MLLIVLTEDKDPLVHVRLLLKRSLGACTIINRTGHLV